MDNKKIGSFICKLRNEKKWTQEDLADRLFVDRTMISKWERGVYIPTTEILLKMQELFDVSINEILFGERKNNDNLNSVDAVPIQIINEEKKKRKKIIITDIVVIFGLLIFFLVYYFINNYNSIKVYKIEGENEEFAVKNGILVFSKEKSYFRVGNLELKNNQNVSGIKLYFIKDNIEKLIFEGGISDLDILFENIFNYNEYFKYDDLEYIINNLRLDIKLEDNSTQTLELKPKKAYENNKIFLDYKQPISDGETSKSKEKIPEYIKQNFTYNKSNESYVRTDNNIKEEYFYNVNVYLITKQSGEMEQEYLCYLNDNIIEFNNYKNNDLLESFSYNFDEEKCNYGNCNLDSINKIRQEYISIFFK